MTHDDNEVTIAPGRMAMLHAISFPACVCDMRALRAADDDADIDTLVARIRVGECNHPVDEEHPPLGLPDHDGGDQALRDAMARIVRGEPTGSTDVVDGVRLSWALGNGADPLADVLLIAHRLGDLRDARACAQVRAEQYRTVIGTDDTAIIACDRDLRILWVDFAAGEEPRDVVGKRVPDTVGPRFARRLEPVLRQAISEGIPTQVELRGLPRGDRRITADVIATPWHESDGQIGGLVITSTDITAFATAMDLEGHEAITDPLTGLLNRRGLIAMLGDETDRSITLVALPLIDLVRQGWGTAVANGCIRAAADALRAAADVGEVVVRLDGARFAVIDGTDGAIDEQRFREGLASITPQEVPDRIPATVLTTTCHPVGHTPDEALQAAEDALAAEVRAFLGARE